MAKYEVKYVGYAIVEADNEIEAEQNFLNGLSESDEYWVDDVREI